MNKEHSMTDEDADIAVKMDINKTGFRAELQTLINRHSVENGSDTPDFILADYMADCLNAYDMAVIRRTMWYKHD